LVAGTREVAVPADRRRMAALTHAAAAELTAFGARIQALFGAPMDIEWAIAGGQSFILQARPITALPEPPVVLDWALPRPAGRYARSSVIELLPDPLSPLFRTLALPAWSRGMNRLMHTFPFGDILPDPSLVSINDYAYYDYGMTAGQSLRMLWGFLAGGRSLARLLGTAATRWSEDARPHYAALATEWAHAGRRARRRRSGRRVLPDDPERHPAGGLHERGRIHRDVCALRAAQRRPAGVDLHAGFRERTHPRRAVTLGSRAVGPHPARPGR
jgi:hypothetical protein